MQARPIFLTTSLLLMFGTGPSAWTEPAGSDSTPDSTSTAPQAALEATPEGLEQAVRSADLESVRRILDAGVDADAELRNGYTAIFHAVDRNQIEIVELLLERGARADHVEGFFHTTPLERAQNAGFDELVLLLLEHQPGRLDQILESDRLEWVRAALAAASPLYEYQKQSALAHARHEGHEEITQILEQAPADPGWPDVELSPGDLARFPGTYGGGPSGEINRTVSLPAEGDSGRLVLEGKGEERVANWIPVGPRTFRSRSHPTHGLSFWGRGQTIEMLTVFGDGEPLTLRRLAPEPTPDPKVPASTDVPAGADKKAETPGPTAQGPPMLKPEKGHWSSFRGPRGDGIADGSDLPLTWDVPSGHHVVWRTEIPGLGLSSPVTDGQRIYLTTAISAAGNTDLELGHYGNPSSVDDDSVHRWQVAAYDLESGRPLWQATAGEAEPGSKRHLKSSQANSTPVTDGQHVVAVFPTAGMVAYRAADGKPLWHTELGALPSGPYGGVVEWGFASSPILWQDQVILQVDIHGGAFIAAWDVNTGRQLWRTARQEIPTWSTPIVVESDRGPELITNGTTIRSYDPRDGRELWWLGPNSEVIVSSPVAGRDLIYITGGYPPARPVYAVRPGSQGDISLAPGKINNRAVTWSKDRGGVYIPTPLAYGHQLYLIHGQGRLEALDAADGQRLYRARLSAGGTVSGSPIAADGRIYIPTEEGQIYVVEAGPEYRELAVNDIAEPVLTTPAVSAGRLYVRGTRHLFALGDPSDSSGKEKESNK